MLAAPNRLTGAADFRAAVRRGQRSGGPNLVLHLLPPTPSSTPPAADDPGPPRVGFVVSRAVGGAVTRNLVKRRLRHLVRERIELLAPGSLLVVRALPPAGEAPYVAVAAELDRALGRWAVGEAR